MKKKIIEPKIFTFDVSFVLQVLAKDEKEANQLCETQGGYVVSREQTLRPAQAEAIADGTH